jgi:hypothetical protein
MAGSTRVGSTGAGYKPPAALLTPSAQFLAAAVQLHSLCMRHAKMHLESLAAPDAAGTAGTVRQNSNSIPWNMVHAIASLGEALLDCRCPLQFADTDLVLITALASFPDL